MFITDKHKPDCPYVRNIPNRRIHFFTLLQLAALVVLCAVSFSPAILALPVMVITTSLFLCQHCCNILPHNYTIMSCNVINTAITHAIPVNVVVYLFV